MSRKTEPRCPRCAGRRIAEVDRIPGYARVAAVAEDGTISWDGETLVDWNGQEPAHHPPVFTCLDCHHEAALADFAPAVVFVAALKGVDEVLERLPLADFEVGTAEQVREQLTAAKESIALARRIFTGDDIA